MSKKAKKGSAPAPSDDAIRVNAHPRASASIRRLRARAGIAALVICALLSLRAGVPAFDAVARGLAAGIAAHFLAWFAGVLVWRHLIVGEIAARREAILAARAEREAAIERAGAAVAAANGA
jgi:hypothetical protein